MNTTGEESSRVLLRTVHTQKVHLKTAAFTTGSGISVLVGQSPSPQNEQITETARKISVLVSQKHAPNAESAILPAEQQTSAAPTDPTPRAPKQARSGLVPDTWLRSLSRVTRPGCHHVRVDPWPARQ
jgi:hypothetical protein